MIDDNPDSYFDDWDTYVTNWDTTKWKYELEDGELRLIRIKHENR